MSTETEATDGLAAFFAARLDELEAVAREGHPSPGNSQTGEWIAYGHQPGLGDRQDRRIQMVGTETEQTGWMVCEVGQFDRAAAIATHIACFDPKSALADIAADRAILDMYEGQDGCDLEDGVDDGRDWNEQEADEAVKDTLEQVVKIRAVRFKDHPDYRAAEWEP